MATRRIYFSLFPSFGTFLDVTCILDFWLMADGSIFKHFEKAWLLANTRHVLKLKSGSN